MTQGRASGATPPSAGTAPPLIALAGVSRAFADADGGTRVEALADVSLTIGAGEFVAIVGASGSGKSTLLNILGCLDRPSDGAYRFNGDDVGGLDADARARLRREAFGFVFQDYCLLDALTARENVELPAKYAGVGRAARAERATRLLESLGLAARAGHRPPELSGGEQQRVAIARALMNGGRVILADEPTGALDTAAGEDLVQRLGALAAAGHTVVVATHDAKVAAKAARRVVLRDGRVVEESAPQVAAHPTLTQPALPARRAWERGGDLARDAWGALAAAWRHRRLGTTLSATSVAIGVWSLVVLLGVTGGGLRDGLESAILHMGADTIHVGRGGQASSAVEPARFDLADAAAIRALPNVSAVEMRTGGRLMVQRAGAGEPLETFVTATDANVSERRDWPLRRGAFYTADDGAALAPVAVIGSTVRDALFSPNDDPIGEQILVGGQPFVVKGVLAPYEAGFLGTQSLDSVYNDNVYLPFGTGLALLFGGSSLNIDVRVAAPERLEATARRLHSLLAGRHGLDTFHLRTSSGSMNEWAEVQRVMRAAWATAGGIAVLLGGFGVLAVTVISVRARRREIGIRVAAGARRRDILGQFLWEAAAVSLAGALLGAIGSAATLYAISRIPAPVAVSPLHVLAALAGATAVGVLFSLLPALRAARLDPVAALSDAAGDG